jgi:hypothetical protein
MSFQPNILLVHSQVRGSNSQIIKNYEKSPAFTGPFSTLCKLCEDKPLM